MPRQILWKDTILRIAWKFQQIICHCLKTWKPCFLHGTLIYRCVMFETQNSLWINTWYSWVILLTLEYMQYMWFSYLINISKLSPLEYTEISTVLIPFALEAILVQFSHNLYVLKIVQMSHSFTYSLRPMIYIINKFLKYYSINDQSV